MKQIKLNFFNNNITYNHVVHIIPEIKNVKIIDDIIIGEKVEYPPISIHHLEGFYYGCAYNRNELLKETVSLGKKIYKILDTSIDYSKTFLEIENITLKQKEKILTTLKEWIEKYNFFSTPYIKNNNILFITFADIIEECKKLIYIYLFYSFLDEYDKLEELFNIEAEYSYIQPRVDTIKSISEKLGLESYINSKNDIEKLVGYMYSTMPHLFIKYNNIALNYEITIYPFAIFDIDLINYTTLKCSTNLFNLSFYILLEDLSIIYSSGETLNSLSKLFYCPICSKVEFKSGKRNILCDKCSKSPKGKKYIKETHLLRKEKRVSDILFLEYRLDNIPISIKERLELLKNKNVDDHFPTQAFLDKLENDIKKYLYK